MLRAMLHRRSYGEQLLYKATCKSSRSGGYSVAQHSAPRACSQWVFRSLVWNNYASFQNAGYQGLYEGFTAKDIHQRKNLNKSQTILDHMGSEELAANLFRITQTEAKMKREEPHLQNEDFISIQVSGCGSKAPSHFLQALQQSTNKQTNKSAYAAVNSATSARGLAMPASFTERTSRR